MRTFVLFLFAFFLFETRSFADPVINRCDDLDNDGWTTCDGDCDDTDPSVNPAQIETCNGIDDDCDGTVDYVDYDSDGWSACDGDCDDNNGSINPGQSEMCNGYDDNCDGNVDDVDNDGDGWYCGDDCDDNNSSINPGQYDDCDGNGVDDDCDGMQDEDGMSYSYADWDYDYYGDPANGGLFCYSTLPYGYVSDNSDCDPNNGSVNPGQWEICNGIDDNCDYVIDDIDLDGDGYSCGDDCNDDDGSINPGSMELCDGIDNNCDTQIDENTAITLTFAKANIDCHGSTNGSINLSATGGNAPYTYNWSNGSTEEDLSGLSMGIYKVTVTNANGCTKKTSNIVITQPAALNFATSVAQTSVSPARYKITVSPSGGVSPPKYQYRIKLSSATTWSNWQTTKVFANRPAGLYNIEVKVVSTTGCSLSMIQTISVPSSLAAVMVAQRTDPVLGTLTIYPNPAKDVLNVVLPMTTSETTTLTILDFTGRTVMVKECPNVIEGTPIDIHLPNRLPNGIYLLTFPDANGKLSTTKFEVGGR